MANFAGTELKLKDMSHADETPSLARDLDFRWACTDTLRYFKLLNMSLTKKDTFAVIVRRLADMNHLVKVKLGNVKVLRSPL